VECNYRAKCGEIDIIAWDAQTLVFVEVRCKRTLSFGTPAESIGFAKQSKLIATAEHYLLERECRDVPCRFDVVEVVIKGGFLTVGDIIKDAFTR